ncbi:conjugal transfer protein TraP [Enterobacter huaxiensis]|uniref:conjugal transfer protein TraP n=1 Tax=Enterobacter huaxiensis TaxID=2494702 RepID=UPI000E75448B|nr:conjugal transfer protein TraP [Enterobacter huaxiensis]UNC52582.1 conjugal transfer protein TraP [Enterobacter huaxiensis]
MMLKLLSVLLYCLRWLAWAFQYLIIWPAATLMLLIIMLFWLDNSTPGQVAADEIAASTRYVSHGEFRIPGHCGPNLGEPLYGERCRSTDAAGYAAFVKNSVDELWRGNLKVLWVVMAVVFSGAALLVGCRPYFCLYGQIRSARFRYGIPASRPAPAPELIKTPDNKKEDDRE